MEKNEGASNVARFKRIRGYVAPGIGGKLTLQYDSGDLSQTADRQCEPEPGSEGKTVLQTPLR